MNHDNCSNTYEIQILFICKCTHVDINASNKCSDVNALKLVNVDVQM